MAYTSKHCDVKDITRMRHSDAETVCASTQKGGTRVSTHPGKQRKLEAIHFGFEPNISGESSAWSFFIPQG